MLRKMPLLSGSGTASSGISRRSSGSARSFLRFRAPDLRIHEDPGHGLRVLKFPGPDPRKELRKRKGRHVDLLRLVEALISLPREIFREIDVRLLVAPGGSGLQHKKRRDPPRPVTGLLKELRAAVTDGSS